MTKIVEVAIAFFEFVLDPKAPLTRLAASNQEGPAAAWGDFYSVSVLSSEIVNRSRSSSLTAQRRPINIAATKHKTNIPPRMVVKVSLVVG